MSAVHEFGTGLLLAVDVSGSERLTSDNVNKSRSGWRTGSITLKNI